MLRDMAENGRPSQRYWFSAKRYGWGWGAPATWEGWAVVAGFLALIGAPAALGLGAPVRVAVVVIASLALIAICWRKGEPPSWRWGK
jgi:hypothetical protein